MSAFAAAVGALFADPNIGRDAVYITDGGAPVLVRVVARRADAVTDFGDARLWSETTRIDLRVAEVPAPRPGDRIERAGRMQVGQVRSTVKKPCCARTLPMPEQVGQETGSAPPSAPVPEQAAQATDVGTLIVF